MRKVFEGILLIMVALCLFTGCPGPESPANPGPGNGTGGDAGGSTGGGNSGGGGSSGGGNGYDETVYDIVDSNGYRLITTAKFFEVGTQLINNKKFIHSSYDNSTYSFGTWVLNKEDFAAKNPTFSSEEVNRAYAHLGLGLRVTHHEYETYEISDQQMHPHDEYDLLLIQNNSTLQTDPYLFYHFLLDSYDNYSNSQYVTMGESEVHWRSQTVQGCPANCNRKYIVSLGTNITDIINVKIQGFTYLFTSLEGNYNSMLFINEAGEYYGYKVNGNSVTSNGNICISTDANMYNPSKLQFGKVSKDMMTMKLWGLPDMEINSYATESREEILAKMGYPYELLDRVNYDCYYKYDFIPGEFPSF